MTKFQQHLSVKIQVIKTFLKSWSLNKADMIKTTRNKNNILCRNPQHRTRDREESRIADELELVQSTYKISLFSLNRELSVLYSWKFYFLLNQIWEIARSRQCQHPLLDSARIKSSFFFTEKSSRTPTSNYSSAKSHFSLQLKKSFLC